ncbi:MAG: dipicolinate synthase subunit DpsA [Clostridia bacterium]|nr:dipicolinate synthase subunit DpsA [Clostridia bacterium]
MDKSGKIAILFGDTRFMHLADRLKTDFRVEVYGVLGLENTKPTPFECVKNCEFLILPLPACKPLSTMINCAENVDLKDIFSVLDKNVTVLSGKANENLNILARQHGINLIDYYTNEFEILNAVPSAEGAIKIALERTDFTLCGSSCLILGFGRIGKVLAKMLSGIGALVTVAARSPEALATAKSLGFDTQNIYDMSSCLNKADIIFNTVPSLILDQKNLLNVKKDALIIDLASKPGGCDFESAKSLKLNFIHALGLPGIIAPKTSSEIIINCICSFIEERRINGT